MILDIVVSPTKPVKHITSRYIFHKLQGTLLITVSKGQFTHILFFIERKNPNFPIFNLIFIHNFIRLYLIPSANASSYSS